MPEYVPEGSEGKGGMDMDEMDAMFVDAARMVVINQQGSAKLAATKIKVGIQQGRTNCGSTRVYEYYRSFSGQ